MRSRWVAAPHNLPFCFPAESRCSSGILPVIKTMDFRKNDGITGEPPKRHGQVKG